MEETDCSRGVRGQGRGPGLGLSGGQRGRLELGRSPVVTFKLFSGVCLPLTRPQSPHQAQGGGAGGTGGTGGAGGAGGGV